MLQRPERKRKTAVTTARLRAKVRNRKPGGGSKPRLGAARAPTVAIRLPAETLERIRALAEQLRISESQTMRSLIAIGLANTAGLSIVCDSDAGNIVTPQKSETTSMP